MPQKKRRTNLFLSFILFILLIYLHCSYIPYVPDETAVIYLTAIPSSIQSGEISKIMVLGEKASGYPLPDGTMVHLFCSAGQIDQEIFLHNGQAEAVYQADPNQSGNAIITAQSGQATISPDQLTIMVSEVSEPDINYIFISANPQELPSEGGKSIIRVLALDSDMLPVANKNIWLETTTGNLSFPGLNTTDISGEIKITLTTIRTATVNAYHKEITASVEITVE